MPDPKDLAADERPIPSQAEGEDEDKKSTEGGTRPRPSQAEGDRETVEEDLKSKR